MSTFFYSMLALLTAFLMALGQMLFKLGATKFTGESLVDWLVSFLRNGYLISAIFLYAATILIWIYVLRVLPLSKAYPLTAVSYILVPILGFFVLNEPFSLKISIGSLLILTGVIVTHV